MIKFITFSEGKQIYYNSAVNLCNELKEAKLFDSIEHYTLKNLEHAIKNHKDFIESNSRGYGYWLWKPFCIANVMNTMQNGDILYYYDSRFTLKNKEYFKTLNDAVKTQKIISSSTYQPSDKWTKMDTCNYILPNDQDKYKYEQLQAGTLVIFVCPETKQFMEEWKNICCINNYHYLDDTDSILQNTDYFVEHRHDQSIFSCLMIKHGFYSLKYNSTAFCNRLNNSVVVKRVNARRARK